MSRARPTRSDTDRLLLACVVLAFVTGCRTVPPLPPVNLSEPGWTVRQGQAVWTPQRGAPGIAGEILVATRPDGRAFVQFSKNPFPLVIAQSTPNQWQVESPADNRHYAGRGTPPRRLIFLYLPRVLSGLPPPKGWSWEKQTNGGWRLTNPSSGEVVEVYF